MSDKNRIAFLANEEVAEKVKKLQKELNLDTPGEVISMGLSLIELALGRQVEFHDRNKIYKTDKFAKYNQTVILENGDS